MMTSIQQHEDDDEEQQPMPKGQRRRQCLSSTSELFTSSADNNNNNNHNQEGVGEGGGGGEEVDVDDSSLLIIGKDCLTCVTSFLNTYELFQSNRICKTFQSVAEPLLNILINQMKRDCDRLPNGEDSDKKKLIRYLSAMDLAKNVRDGLSSHLLKPIEGRPECYKPECNGCKNFPQTISNETMDQRYDYFLYIFDDTDHEAPIKYQGFLPAVRRSPVSSSSLSFYLDLNQDMNMEKWPKMACRQLERPTFDRNGLNEIFTIGLSAVIVAVKKASNKAVLCGASQDYSNSGSRFIFPSLKLNSNYVHSVVERNQETLKTLILNFLTRERLIIELVSLLS